ncbi:MAG: SLC45 family MFS transporter [Anaerolineae bacterium]|nr:SLC45 family MFS transporter [Anaerolineae bacterium]
MKRVSGWYIFVLNAYWIGLSFMWNSLHVTILPAVLLKYIPETQKNTWLGLLTFFGLILAMLIQPLSGAISDRWQSKMGKRRPFMWLGTGGDLIFLAIMGFIGGLPALFIGYIGLQTSSNIAHGPAQGLLPDEVPASQLGMASGIKTTMDMAGIILSSLLMGFLISAKDPDPTLSTFVIIGFLILFSLITLLGSREKSTYAPQRIRVDWKALWKSVFYFKAEGDKNYWRLIFSRFLYLVGIYGFQSFAQYFIRDKFSGQDPIQFTQFVMGSFVIVLMIFSLFSGRWSDKIGRKRLQIASSYVGALGSILIIFATTPFQLILFGSILGAGLGIFLATNWALANQMAPAGDVGKYIGLTNLATAGSAAVARLEGPLTDVLNNAAPGQWWGWTALFAISAVLMLGSALAMRKVPEFKGVEAAKAAG